MELFDLHCDTLVTYQQMKADFLCDATMFSLRNQEKLTRMCQTMAIFVPDEVRGKAAEEYFDQNSAYLKSLIKKQPHLAAQAFSGEDVERITGEGKCALILSAESGACLGGRLERVEELYEAGVRFLGLVWNGENELGSGHSNEKRGLTEFGRQVIRRMEQLSMIVDVSHLNDRGFDQVCEVGERPFIATHSNLRSVAGHMRNLTEDQFQEIVRRGGLVGINLCRRFLSDEGVGDEEDIFRHVYRMLELGGENVIACGSDFDGTDVFSTLDRPEKFAAVSEYLVKRGIRQEDVKKMFFENALKFVKREL